MSDFKELERALLQSVEASVRKSQSSSSDGSPHRQAGFGEAPQSFDNSEDARAIEAAEAACLEYQVDGIEELQKKTEFILQQMRQLTDETEEFDVYAEVLLADIRSLMAPPKS